MKCPACTSQQEVQRPTKQPHAPSQEIHGSARGEGIPDSRDLQLPGGDA